MVESQGYAPSGGELDARMKQIREEDASGAEAGSIAESASSESLDDDNTRALREPARELARASREQARTQTSSGSESARQASDIFRNEVQRAREQTQATTSADDGGTGTANEGFQPGINGPPPMPEDEGTGAGGTFLFGGSGTGGGSGGGGGGGLPIGILAVVGIGAFLLIGGRD